MSRIAALFVGLLVAACTRAPEPQAFSAAVPEPARGLAFTAGGRCNLDLVSGTPTPLGWRTGTVKPLLFSGWALESVTQPASPWIVVELVAPGDRARYFALTTQRNTRADLASLGDGPGVRNAAFELVAGADQLPRGRYSIWLLMRGGASGLVCATGKTLELI